MTTQEKVIQIIEDILEIEQVGPNDRFEDIGGNSLSLVKVLERVKQSFGCAPKPRMFFDREQSTMASIARAIDEQLNQSQPSEHVRAS